MSEGRAEIVGDLTGFNPPIDRSLGDRSAEDPYMFRTISTKFVNDVLLLSITESRHVRIETFNAWPGCIDFGYYNPKCDFTSTRPLRSHFIPPSPTVASLSDLRAGYEYQSETDLVSGGQRD